MQAGLTCAAAVLQERTNQKGVYVLARINGYAPAKIAVKLLLSTASWRLVGKQLGKALQALLLSAAIGQDMGQTTCAHRIAQCTP